MVANDGSTVIQRKRFIYNYLAYGEGRGGWPRMGPKIESELCFRLIRDMAYLLDLRSRIDAGLTAYSEVVLLLR